jgi:hypothetical protein
MADFWQQYFQQIKSNYLIEAAASDLQSVGHEHQVCSFVLAAQWTYYRIDEL